MTIDSSYEQLAALRNSAKVLYPIFMAVSLGKVAWIVLPQLSRNQTADTLGTAVFCLGCGGGVVAWLMAGLGTRYEHFGSVMLFNVLTACAIIFVRLPPPRCLRLCPLHAEALRSCCQPRGIPRTRAACATRLAVP